MAGTVDIDIEFRVSVDGESVPLHVRKLERFPVLAADKLRQAVNKLFLLAQAYYVKTGYAEAGLKVRSARLRRGVGFAAEGIAEVRARSAGDRVDIIGRFGSAVPYWPVQELGATIFPKTASSLHFPILAAGGGRTIVGWRRAKKVTVPARPAVRLSLEAIIARDADRVFGDLIDEAAAEAVA